MQSKNLHHNQRAATLRKTALVLSIVVMLTSILVLIGWQFDLQTLTKMFSTLNTMKPLTAVSSLLMGASIYCLHFEKPQNKIALGLGVVITVIGSAILFQYITNINLHIDQILFRQAVLAEGGLYAGRPSPTTAVSIFLFGIIVISFYYQKYFVSLFFTPLVLILNLLAIVGYAYNVSFLYQIGFYSPIALHTAILFLIATIALLFTRPEQPPLDRLIASFSGGEMARRLLPFAILLPFVFGWLRLQGQRAGYYGTEFGLALFATTNIIFFTVLIYITAGLLNKSDETKEITFQELMESEKRYRNTLDTMLEGCQIIGFDWTYLYVNDAATKHGQQTKENLIGHKMMNVYPSIENTSLFKVMEKCMYERISLQMENEFAYVDGSKGWFELGIQPVQNGIFILSIDISERKLSQLALQDAEKKYRTLVEQSPSMVYLDEVGGKWQYVSPQIENLLGYTVNQWLNEPELFHKHIHAEDKHRLSTLLEKSKQNDERFICEYRFVKDTGEIVWLHDEAIFVKDDINQRILMQGVLYDITKQKLAEEDLRELNLTLEQRVAERTAELEEEITKRKQAEEALRQEAIRDPLTNLFNRRFMQESLSREIQRAKRKKNSLAVVIIDFDYFKKLNDTFGHGAGDEVLRSFATLLKTKIREADIPCRYGGEEFVLILPDVSLDDAIKRMQEIRNEIKLQTIRYNEIKLKGFTLSMGIAMFPEHHQTSQGLLQKADEALYQAKQNGRDRIMVTSTPTAD